VVLPPNVTGDTPEQAFAYGGTRTPFRVDELGHTDIKTTDGYAHVLDEQRQAMLSLKGAAVAAAISQYGQEVGRESRKVVGIEAAKGRDER